MLQNSMYHQQADIEDTLPQQVNQSKELLESFSKKNIVKRFVAFLQEECKDL